MKIAVIGRGYVRSLLAFFDGPKRASLLKFMDRLLQEYGWRDPKGYIKKQKLVN